MSKLTPPNLTPELQQQAEELYVLMGGEPKPELEQEPEPEINYGLALVYGLIILLLLAGYILMVLKAPWWVTLAATLWIVYRLIGKWNSRKAKQQG